ncbi:hypothetical protein [Micromonospora haikouensis]|uniref:hypothetical protein n=1 Tax=Micromonospora haikouensis TaxID=686309 RepID=UPI003D715168
MTVTFTAQFQPTDLRGFTGSCLADPTIFTTGVLSSRLEAVMATRAHAVDCSDADCRHYGGQVTADEVVSWPEVNVSNANAWRLLDALGYLADEEDPELSGEADAELFLGRVLLALAVAPADAGIPSHTRLDNPRVIDLGVCPGYLQERLARLRELAEACHTAGRQVTWF